MRADTLTALFVSTLLLTSCGNWRTEKGETLVSGAPPITEAPRPPDGGPGGGTPPPPPVVVELKPTFSSIQANILKPRCERCHSGARPDGDLNLSSYARMMNAAPPVVRPGDPDFSSLYNSLMSDTRRMPKDEPALPAIQIRTIARWIANGAKND